MKAKSKSNKAGSSRRGKKLSKGKGLKEVKPLQMDGYVNWGNITGESTAAPTQEMMMMVRKP
ncbi:MAG TPA: hypothetical protein VLY23_08025 [Candidatus Acidoferrum sp.]|nr:hypothetical protein [Candidatus Acidoferrum sp.]